MNEQCYTITMETDVIAADEESAAHSVSGLNGLRVTDVRGQGSTHLAALIYRLGTVLCAFEPTTEDQAFAKHHMTHLVSCLNHPNLDDSENDAKIALEALLKGTTT